MSDSVTKDLQRRMVKAVDVLREEYAGLRTGRASTGLVDNLMVNAYGSQMPLNQLATLSVPEPRTISVQPWDKSMAKAIEKAIRDSDLGLNPIPDGGVIRIPIPELTEERRKDLVKLVFKYSEQAKIAIRNLRREGIDTFKKREKSKEISQDELHLKEKEVQDLTDRFIKEIDEVASHKEAEVMQV